MLLDTAEGSANLKDKAPMRTFCDSVCKLLSTVISDYSCQDPGAPGSGSAKSRRKANVKHAYNIKFLKMKNLIGSLAEDFHCFETSALSNQKPCLNKKLCTCFLPIFTGGTSRCGLHLDNPGLHVSYFRVPS